MASPSAPTCVVTATRSRVYRNSATSATVLFVVRIVNRSYLPQSALYPGYLLDHRVRLEAEPRRALQARLRPDGRLDAAGRAPEARLGLLRVRPGEHAVEDRGLREVRAHVDARDRHESPNAGVGEGAHLLAHDLLQLRLHPARAPAHSFKISSRFSSAAPRETAASASSTVARCQASWWSDSTTETFLRRRRSFTDRRVWRFSFKLEAKGNSSSSLTVQNKALGLPRDLDDLEELEDVALLDIVEVLDADPALEALADRADVVLEAPERGDVPLVDHGPVAHHAHAVVAEDLTSGHVAASDRAGVRDPEDRAHLGGPRLVLGGLGGQHAAHGGLDLLEGLVDHVVGPDLHALPLGYLLGGVRRPDVETEQDAVTR